MPYEQILYSESASVATITLNRPEKLNAMTALMGAELADALAHADERDEVRAVIVTGAGRAFCAGADLGDGQDTKGFSDGWGTVDRSAYRRRSPQQVRKPVIAAVNGPCVGVALTWALQCDVRIVAEDAKLAFSFVRRGVVPELGSHVLLPRLVGFDAAFDLLVTGRTFLGQEAAELGLCRRAVPADVVLPTAQDLAAQIAEYSAPVSTAICKRLLWEGISDDYSRVLDRENVLYQWSETQPDSLEGTVSFFEKRPPRWSMSVSKDLPPWPE